MRARRLVHGSVASRAYRRILEISQVKGGGNDPLDLARVGGDDPLCLGTVGSFLPWSLPGAFWGIRGDFASTSGGSITGVTDQSGAANNLTQPTVASEPLPATIAGQPAMGYTTGQVLYVGTQAMPAGASATMAVFWQLTSALGASAITSVATIVSAAGAAFGEIFLCGSSSGYRGISFYIGSTNGTSLGILWTPDTSAHFAFITWDGAGQAPTNYRAWLDGSPGVIAASGAFARTGTDLPSVGARANSSGVASLGLPINVAEVDAWAGVMSATNRALVFNYAQSRYGL